MRKLTFYSVGIGIVLIAYKWAALSHVSPDKIDQIVIEKSYGLMHVFKDERRLKSYRIALGSQPVGPKACQGDGKTPEGKYQIIAKNGNSGYHKSLKISYPNSIDLKRAQENGCNPGGDIMIHGIKNGLGWIRGLHSLMNWTQGCIAVADHEMDEIFGAVDIGTPVEIQP